jgi:N-acetylglucosamine-6-phosphate deacetylase
MIVLSGAALVLPDRILSPGTLIIEGTRIADVRDGTHPDSSISLRGHYVVPGFIDVHVHGIEGVDSLDGGGVIAAMSERLPRYGVTAFCPTTVACAPEALREVLDQVRSARETPARGARVLPAHLESNFISADYAGAQPPRCLRTPREALHDILRGRAAAAAVPSREFDGADILDEIQRARSEIAIVTVAPELDGGMDLVRWLNGRGHRVSLGHSGASYDQAVEAIAAGASQATHLFNRMPPLGQRVPGLAGAVLEHEQIAAELICDGVHVHPAMLKVAIAAKRPARILAITDGTAGSGLEVGAHASLGGRDIVVGEDAARLGDGTLAGSVTTMDRVFLLLVETVGLSLVDAAIVCSTTAARELGLADSGALRPGAAADLTVLDEQFSVVQTYVGGQLVYSRNTASPM